MKTGKKLCRSGSDKAIAGVCSGLAERMGTDPIVIRLLFVLLAMFAGLGIIVYIVLALAIPSEKKLAEKAAADDMFGDVPEEAPSAEAVTAETAAEETVQGTVSDTVISDETAAADNIGQISFDPQEASAPEKAEIPVKEIHYEQAAEYKYETADTERTEKRMRRSFAKPLGVLCIFIGVVILLDFFGVAKPALVIAIGVIALGIYLCACRK